MKLILKVDILGNTSVKMTIVQIAHEAIKRTQSIDSLIFKDNDCDIIIWSWQDFVFDERQIRLPQENKMMKMTHTQHFKSDKERYETLKKYYYLLNKWALNTRMFPNTDTDIKNRVRINGNFWQVI